MSDDDRLVFPEDEDEDDLAGWDGYLAPRVWFPIGLLGLAAVAFLGVMLVLNWDRGGDAAPSPGDQPGEPGSTLRQDVHWHADFALYIRGEEFDFSDPQFISTADDELGKAVHIHEPRHNVVHVHLSSSTWGEFFESLGFTLADTCIGLPGGEDFCETADDDLTFIVNGVEVDSLRFQYIGDLDRVLITYGPEAADELLEGWDTLVGDEACIPSGTCSARFPEGGLENEPCSVGSTVCN